MGKQSSGDLLVLFDAKKNELEDADRFYFGDSSFSARRKRIIYSFSRYGLKGFYWLSVFWPISISAKTFWDKKILVNIPDNISTALLGTLSQEEIPLIRFLLKHLDQDSVFYDVGAHIGFYSCLASEISKEIHSFEPNPKTFSLLKKNVHGYTNQIALSNHIEEKIFYADLNRMFGTSGFSEKQGFSKINVKTTTIDEYVKTHTAPTIIKIDVEGCEEEVLEGARETLKKYNPIVAVEVWKKSVEPPMFKELGYVPYAIMENGEIKRMENMELREGIPSHNFIFQKIA